MLYIRQLKITLMRNDAILILLNKNREINNTNFQISSKSRDCYYKIIKKIEKQINASIDQKIHIFSFYILAYRNNVVKD